MSVFENGRRLEQNIFKIFVQKHRKYEKINENASNNLEIFLAPSAPSSFTTLLTAKVVSYSSIKN